MTDPTDRLAELQSSRQRWKLATVTLAVLLGITLVLVIAFAVQLGLKARQAEMEAVRQRDRAEYARRLAAEQAARAIRGEEGQGKDRPDADGKPKD